VDLPYLYSVEKLPVEQFLVLVLVQENKRFEILIGYLALICSKCGYLRYDNLLISN
jgi:hypothetical protein